MKVQTIEHLQYFLGKVCSIITTAMNRSFDETIAREHFVIRVKEVNLDGIWGTHPYNDEMISFFSINHIISIHQEVEIDPSNPEHIELLNEYEAKTGKKVKSDMQTKTPKSKPLNIVEKPIEIGEGDTTFVDIASLEKLAESTKKMLDAQEFMK